MTGLAVVFALASATTAALSTSLQHHAASSAPPGSVHDFLRHLARRPSWCWRCCWGRWGSRCTSWRCTTARSRWSSRSRSPGSCSRSRCFRESTRQDAGALVLAAVALCAMAWGLWRLARYDDRTVSVSPADEPAGLVRQRT